MEHDVVRKLPMNYEETKFGDWHISYERSHILKSCCIKGIDSVCTDDDAELCSLCLYRKALDLPHLPDMVFHKNKLTVAHADGAKMEFSPMEALRRVENGKQSLQVACAQEWKEGRPECHMEEKFKPFDWTFTTDYQGTLNEKFRVEKTEQQLNKFKLMQRENILFYHDLTLFEDELHDNGISQSSVKIRVMPSGFFILLRHFLRVDNVLLKMHDTRFHYEVENDYIFREFIKREATYTELASVPPPLFTLPNEIEGYLPIKGKETHKLFFK